MRMKWQAGEIALDQRTKYLSLCACAYLEPPDPTVWPIVAYMQVIETVMVWLNSELLKNMVPQIPNS